MFRVLALGLTRIPRIVLLGLIAFKFGINEDTDSFFLIYSIVLFLVAIIGFTAELFSPNRKTLVLGILCSTLCMLVLALITSSLLAFLFIPYVLLSSSVSVIIGTSNLRKDYRVLFYTSTPYLVMIIPVLLLDININGLVIILSVIELVRIIIAYPLTKSITIPSPVYSWQHAAGMLSAVVIGASAGVIDKLFATTLDTGSVTLLGYSYGVVLPLTNILTYGINASRIVNPRAEVNLLPSLIALVVL
ncbi:hypothetical protein LCGC14_2319980, partial [marine sediment metagenome]